MWDQKQVLLLFCAIIGFARSGEALTTFGKTKFKLDSIKPCSIKDSDCLTALYQKILRESSHGIPEIGMPITDPFNIRNASVTILDLITITMESGFAKGVRNCIIHKVRADLDVKNFTMDFTCDMVILGNYKVTSNPIVEDLIGGEVHGEGVAKVELGKLRIQSGYEFFVRKGKDDDIYCDYDYSGMKFKFTFGKFKAHANNLYIGDQDFTEPFMQMLNTNWRVMLPTFGQPFVQKGMDFFFEFTHMFYDNVPTKKYIIEDLSYLMS